MNTIAPKAMQVIYDSYQETIVYYHKEEIIPSDDNFREYFFKILKEKVGKHKDVFTNLEQFVERFDNQKDFLDIIKVCEVMFEINKNY